MTVMAAERIGTSASRTLYSVREAVLGSPILLFDRHHPSVPTCTQSVPSRAAAVKDGPVFGPPLQRRAASLTAASTAARSVVWGNRYTPIQPSKSAHARPSKTEITLTLVRDILGLTLAEARVAALVGSGQAPREAAGKLGITEETARTVLKRVFAKVGVSRQSELASLLTKLVLR